VKSVYPLDGAVDSHGMLKRHLNSSSYLLAAHEAGFVPISSLCAAYIFVLSTMTPARVGSTPRGVLEDA
jgi:hypothetical protein